MKGLFTYLLISAFIILSAFTAFSDNTRTAPVIGIITGNGADITVSWTEPDWFGIDGYEVQLGRTNENGGSFRVVKTAKADVSETSYDFVASQKGYYSARVRARDVAGKYSSWSALSDVVVVKSEDVSNASPSGHFSDSYKGPGVSMGISETYVPSGPGAGSSSSHVSSHTSEKNLPKRGYVRVNTYTSNGWQSDAKGRWYLFGDGSYPMNCWERIDGLFYHFDSSGYMDWNKWIKDADGSWRFCTADGVMATGWNNISEKWYYMEPGNGVMLEAGEHIIDGKIFYINAGGDRLTSGWAGGYYYGADGARA